MSAVADSQASTRATAAFGAAGLFGGFVLFAFIDAVAIAFGVPCPRAGIALRLQDHLFDAIETLGLGALLSVVVFLAGWSLLGLASSPRSRTLVLAVVAPLLSFAANVALVAYTVGHFLQLLAIHGRDGQLAGPIFVFYLTLVAGLLAAAPYAASLVSDDYPRLRLAPAVLAAATMIAAQLPLRDDYEGAHCLAVWGSILLAVPSLAPVTVRAARSLARGLLGRALLVVVSIAAALGLLVVPSNAVRAELFRQPCALAPWVLATVRWPAPSVHAATTPSPSPWLRSRAQVPPIPPSEPPLLAKNAVVVVLTIDALRADVVADPANDARLSTFAKLKQDGVVFTHASSAGSETVVSLSELFADTYFSQQRWGDYGRGISRFAFPAEDTTTRFPELLSQHGVSTHIVGPLAFFADDYGMTRGFRKNEEHVQGKLGGAGSQSIHVLLKALEEPHPDGAFLYTHLLEPHAPYLGGGPVSTDHARYLSAVQLSDRLVGKVLDALRSRFGDDWVLIVSADHGEAFGDHETTTHAKTLYEELLHVPLIVRSPRFAARTIDQRVGLIDLAPTILDLFQLPTPGTFMGESLVPLLRGGDAQLTRPLFAEGRLRRALTFPDGLKVIDDPLRKVVQVYDLARDPGETENLFDTDPARSDTALATLRAFFAAQTLRDGGYVPPYAP